MLSHRNAANAPNTTNRYIQSCRTPSPDQPAVESSKPQDTVGIDFGITTFIHDSDNRSFESLDEQRDRDRIERRHRNLPRKEHGSNNWDQPRQHLAKAYDRLQNCREGYREKLAHTYTTRYDAVLLEDLDVKAIMQSAKNSRTAVSVSWRQTIWALKRYGENHGFHAIKVPPEGTTKRCSQCGRETDKPL